jgi:hypothetical protein
MFSTASNGVGSGTPQASRLPGRSSFRLLFSRCLFPVFNALLLSGAWFAPASFYGDVREFTGNAGPFRLIFHFSEKSPKPYVPAALHAHSGPETFNY